MLHCSSKWNTPFDFIRVLFLYLLLSIFMISIPLYTPSLHPPLMNIKLFHPLYITLSIHCLLPVFAFKLYLQFYTFSVLNTEVLNSLNQSHLSFSNFANHFSKLCKTVFYLFYLLFKVMFNVIVL